MIHPTAIVSKEAGIGEGVEIGAYAIIEDNTRIGDGTKIAAHAVIKSGSRIGNAVTIDSFSVIAGLPQDSNFKPETLSYAQVGDRSVVREGVTINRATQEGGSTILGDDCMMMAVTHLGHDCVVGNRVIMANNTVLAGFVTVGDGAFFGGLAGVHQFCRIGQGVMVGGDAAISVDIPPFTMVAERNHIYGLNVIGLKRSGSSADEIRALKTCFESLYSSQSGIRACAAEMAKSGNYDSELCQSFLEFFTEGKRGFARPVARS